jgi:hypothetical protein
MIGLLFPVFACAMASPCIAIYLLIFVVKTALFLPEMVKKYTQIDGFSSVVCRKITA